MIKTLRVSDKGQISLPVSIREKLGISRGDDLILFEVDGKLLLEKQEKVKDDVKDILKFSEQSLKEIWNNPEDEIWGNYIK